MDNVEILNKSIAALTSNIDMLEDRLKSVSKDSKEWKQAQEQLLDLQQKLADKQKQLADSTKEIADSQSKSTTEIKNQNTEIQNNTKSVGDWRDKMRELRNEQKELTTQMTLLNLEGKQGSEEYLKLAERAGQLRDAMSDARREMNRYADDSMRISDVIEVVQFGTGIFSTYSGVVSLLGIKSESTEKIMRKFAETTQILNGLQAINNTLMNKSSIIMRAYHGVVGLCTKATVAWTAASKGVKAAIASTGIGLLVVAVGELVTHWKDLTDAVKNFIGTSNDAGDSIESLAQKSDEMKGIMSEQTLKILENKLKLNELIETWKTLKTVEEQNQFLKDNQKWFEELGISVNDVNKAEIAFGKAAPIISKLIEQQGQKAMYTALKLEALKESFNKFVEQYTEQGVKDPIKAAAETITSEMKLGWGPTGVKALEKEIKSLDEEIAKTKGELKQLGLEQQKTTKTTTSHTTSTRDTTKSVKDNTKAIKQNIEQLKLQGNQLKKNIDLQKQYDSIYGEVDEDIINLAKLDIDLETLTKTANEYKQALLTGKLTTEEQKEIQKEYLLTTLEIANTTREHDILQERIHTEDFRKEIEKRIAQIERLGDIEQQTHDLEISIKVKKTELYGLGTEEDGKATKEYLREEAKWNFIIDLAKQKQADYNDVLSKMRDAGISETDSQFEQIQEQYNSQTDVLSVLYKQREEALLESMIQGLSKRSELRNTELEQEKKEREQKMQIAENVAEIYRTVSDIYAESLQKQIDAGELSQDEAEELFEKQKKINIATALVTGLTGTFGNFALTLKDLTLQPTWFRMALAYTNLATGLATTFAQVQQIKNQTLNGASSGSAGSVSYVPQAKPILNEERDLSQLANIQTATTTNETTIQTDVIVSERDITRTQNKVNVRERNSKF